MVYAGTLTMPSNYVIMNEEEMLYLEGGIGAPNWLVGGAINLAISAVFGGVGTFLATVSKNALTSASKKLFARQLKNQLIAKGVAAGVASGVCGFVPALLTLCGAILDPGGWLAERFDSKDCKANNGWCDVS